MPFALLMFLFLHIEAWQVSLTSVLSLFGCIGLFLAQRWAAVLVCGLCWFGLATLVYNPFPGDPALQSSPEGMLFLATHGALALLLIVLPPLCSRRLKHGLWTRPASCPQAAVVAVLAGTVWLGFHLHNLVEWESEAQARIRICALILTIGAMLLALLWPRKAR